MEGLGTTEEISEPGGKSFAAGLQIVKKLVEFAPAGANNV